MSVPSVPSVLRSRAFTAPTEGFRARTTDGVDLLGAVVGTADDALVLCHGFMGWHRKDRLVALAEALSRWFSVWTFDMRGHGRSGGLCTFGDLEMNDVAAVVDRARAAGHGRIATVGASMGGVAVIRHAALLGGTDAVVAVSTPSRWDGHRSEAVRRMIWFTSTQRGRRVSRALGVRLAAEWNRPESPEELVGKIAPVPLVLVHGRDDHFFEEEEAWRLYRAAGEPKRLLLASRFGHAEDGFSPAFADRVARLVRSAWGLAPEAAPSATFTGTAAS